MFKNSKAFSSFSVDDLKEAKKFYAEILGLKVTEEDMGMLFLHLSGGGKVMLYKKESKYDPAKYTALNFPVDNVEKAVDALIKKGVKMERYKGFDQDAKGISRSMGITIAWFTDPTGNIIAVLEEK